MRPLRSLLVVVLLIAVVAAPNGSSLTRAQMAPAVRLAGSIPPPVLAGTAQQVSISAARVNQPLTLTVVLNRSDQAGFETYLADVQSPQSPNFRRFLSQAELAQRFGPSQHAYDAVLTWLQSQGFTLEQGSTNRLTLTVMGTRRQVERAVGVTINDYLFDGRTVYANAQDPTLPGAIAGYVQAISGLSNVAIPKAPSKTTTPDNIRDDCRNAALNYIPVIGGVITGFGIPYMTDTMPDFSKGIGPQYFLGIFGIGAAIAALLGSLQGFLMLNALSSVYCAGEVAGYYHRHGHVPSFSSPLAPAGTPATGPVRAQSRTAQAPRQKIGIVAYDTFYRSDVRDWLSLVGADPDPIMSHLSVVPLNGGVNQPGPNESEVLLDIDTVLGLTAVSGYAPSTDVAVYVGPDSTSFQQMFNAMIDDGVTVVSNSWSSCEDQVTLAEAQAIDSVLAQAAASGISVFNGSGDHGSMCFNGSPDTIGVPASSPNATTVGGTTPILGPGMTVQGERWWGASEQNPPTGQGGFGVSRYFARPSYQDGLTASSMRSIPDIAINADPVTGIQICHTNGGGCPSGLLYGGTSMAAPEMAALTAGLNQALGSNLGNANAAFYRLARTDPSTFHSPASMQSDFAHVGLGSPNLSYIQAVLTGQGIGPVDPAASLAAGGLLVPADGTTPAVLRVLLLDRNGLPVTGKAVTVTPNPDSQAVVSVASGSSDGAGNVIFTATSTVSETVTFTVTVPADNVTLAAHPSIHFVPPPATSGSITASPATVPADGRTPAMLTVTLLNALGQGAEGKTVLLSQGSGHAVLTGSGVTDANGRVTFEATNLTAETVTFTAVNVTDGNLPVPGSAEVAFTSGTGSNVCPASTPTAGAGLAFSTFASGFYNGNLAHLAECGGPAGIAFDAAGNAYVGNIITGEIFRFGPGGGVATGATRLTPTGLGTWLIGLAFGKTGDLYALQTFTTGGSGQGKIYVIDTSNGSIVRTVAHNILGPTSMSVDPISGDLFVGNGFNGGPITPAIVRIHDPGTGQPPVDCTNFRTSTTGCTTYAEPGQVDAISFDPSGTLYVRGAGTTGYNPNIWSITGTNSAQPGTVTLLDSSLPGGGGLAVLRPETDGTRATVAVSRRVDSGYEFVEVDLNRSPVEPVPMLMDLVRGTGGPVGPDGCLYAFQSNSILKITSASGACPFAPASVVPTLLLSSNTLSATTGTAVTLTATLDGVSPVQGRDILFTVAGANPQVKQVTTDAAGVATFTYTGTQPGRDQVVATTSVVTTTLISFPASATWTSGRHVTFVSLNQSPAGGWTGRPVTLAASLTDITATPPAPIGGAPIVMSLGSQTCLATTDRAGRGFCVITPNQQPGIYRLTASYAGDDRNTPDTDAASFTIALANGKLSIFLPVIRR